MDIIFLHGLRCDCYIGVWDWEKQITQPLTLDIELGTAICKAVKTDDLKDALDYSAIAEAVTKFAENSKFDLIESLAEQVAALIQKEFEIQWLRVKVAKANAVKNAKQVGVVIERGNKNNK